MREPLDLAPIKARVSVATPGWWKAKGETLVMGAGDGPFVTLRGWPRGDREFVQAARTDVPALIAEVERLRAALEQANMERATAQLAHKTACARIQELEACKAQLVDENARLTSALEVIRDYFVMSWSTFEIEHPGMTRGDTKGPRLNIAAYAAAALGGGAPAPTGSMNGDVA